METQIWIIGQIAIDLLMVMLLLWFLKFQKRRQMTWQDHEAVIQKSAAILSEMQDISRSLEKNLEEKKALSGQILEQLDQGLKRAEESYRRLSEIIPKSGNPLSQQGVVKDSSNTRSSVLALIEKGLSRKEIGRHLGISVGEIELMLKLKPPTSSM